MQKQSLLFKLILCFIFISLIKINSQAQTGLNFQGVARGSNNVILASQQISLRLSILQGTEKGSAEYIETRKVTTNTQGLFAVVIGDADAISTSGNFGTINWKNTPKFLKIEMDAAAGNNFITIGTTQFQYVAYAQYAKTVDAENIEGILPVSKGGTGLSSNAALKSALSLDKINNTADVDKPISIKTQAALDLIAVTATDTTRFFKRINSKADTADVNIITTKLETKLNAADTIKFTKQVYTDSLLLTKLKITDTAAMLSSRITRDTLNLSKRINLKANTTDLSLGLELKENISNKSAATDLGGTSSSDVLFPTQKAVKEYVAANAASGGVADGGITTIKLANGAVAYSKFQSIPTNTILGNTSSTTAYVQAITTTGSDNVVLSTSPTITSPILISPNIGIATADSINHISFGGLKDKSTNQLSLFIRGDAQISGDNRGDNAINNRYDSLLLNGGPVNLYSTQNIIGEKSFSSNITMNNLAILGGTNSPTTINFANGSQIGDIQNINDRRPDSLGSIDLFAPWNAKWVQMNYGNTNYMTLDGRGAYIYLGGLEWNFLGYGDSEFPGNLSIGNNFGINDTATINSSANLKIKVENYKGDYLNWNFNNNSSTDLPGDLNFTDDHFINFISSGTSTPTNNSSIYASGPYLQLKTREATSDEISAEEINWGLALKYGDKSIIKMDDVGINLGVNTPNDATIFSLNNTSLHFLANSISSGQKHWIFNGEDGTTTLPGDLNLSGGSLKISNIDFSSLRGSVGDALTLDDDGSVKWSTIHSSSGINSINGIPSGTQSLTVEISNTATAPSFNSDPITSIHSLSLPMASANSVTAGLLSKTDYDQFNGKQSALLNPITGTESGSYTRTSGLIPFFYGSENTITGSANLFWDATNNRLGIGTQTPNYPVQIHQGGLDEFGFLISSPPPGAKAYGSSIGFESNVGGIPNSYKGSFQLDASGNMVFRTLQSDLYFDNFGNGTTFFRVGSETNNLNGMTLGNTGNLEVHGSVSALSDMTTTGSIKTGIFVQDFSNNYVYTPTAIITAAGDMTTPGSITAQHVSAIDFTTTSDIRLKKNIITLENSLSVINKLNPVAYDKKQNLASVDYSNKENGFIAQELQKILPDLVHESADKDKLLSINYTAIIPILTKGMQEQQAIIEDQKKRLEALEKLVNDLIQKK